MIRFYPHKFTIPNFKSICVLVKVFVSLDGILGKMDRTLIYWWKKERGIREQFGNYRDFVWVSVRSGWRPSYSMRLQYKVWVWVRPKVKVDIGIKKKRKKMEWKAPRIMSMYVRSGRSRASAKRSGLI